MWTAKIRFSSEGTLIGEKAVKYMINIFAFPLAWQYEKKWVVVHIMGTIFGNEGDKKKFVKGLKEEKRVLNFELNDNFFVGTIKEPSFARAAYSKNIIQLAPAYISEKGYEIIKIGSFDKKDVLKVASVLEKHRGGELLFVKKEKTKSISIVKVRPELTDKQRKAIELAIKNGYYHYPRETDVQKLAKISGLSFSTYQVHLRKAEAKLIPYYFE